MKIYEWTDNKRLEYNYVMFCFKESTLLFSTTGGIEFRYGFNVSTTFTSWKEL